MRHHDLIVIGSGSGNSFLDARFDQLDVALVDGGTFGGTCLNVGCIPTKMLVHPADVARSVRRASHLGIDATVDKVRWTDVRDRVFGRIDPISAAGVTIAPTGAAHITLYEAHARFTGPRRLVVDLPGGRSTLTADRVVVAAGSRPTVPPVVAESGVPFHTSDTVMRIDTLPEHLVILGSGYIAAEFAHVFSALRLRGVDRRAAAAPMLRGQDETVAERFTALARDRWDVHLGAEPVRVRGDGAEVVARPGRRRRRPWRPAARRHRPPPERRPARPAPRRASRLTRTAGSSSTSTSARPPTGCSPSVTSARAFQLKHVANHESRVVAHNLLHPDAPQAHRPPVRAVGGVHRAADRRRRAH